jgi:DNA-binding response OmpR family regulator
LASILLIEPEPALARLFSLVLLTEGHDIIHVHDGGKGAGPAELGEAAAVLIDIAPPEEDHLEILRRTRANTPRPIIAMSATVRPEVRRSIVDSGVDDFVMMPFDPDELFVRIQLLVEPPEDGPPGAIRAGRLSLDIGSRRALLDGTTVPLSLSEWKLLEELGKELGEPRTKAELIAAAWGPAIKGDYEFLDRWMEQLQRKLGCDPAKPSLIRPYHNVGYVLVSDH